jgi:hypothetical protein
MLEPMTVWIEAWPVAADNTSLWLISGHDAWRSGPVMADDEPHAELEHVLIQLALMRPALTWFSGHLASDLTELDTEIAANGVALGQRVTKL